MVELSNFKAIWRPGHDFPIIPGSANLIPGSPEKILVYDVTGIPLELLIKCTFLREEQRLRLEIDENPGYFPGSREFYRRAAPARASVAIAASRLINYRCGLYRCFVAEPGR